MKLFLCLSTKSNKSQAIISLLLIVLQAAALPIKIQPLGDSITMGGPGQLVPVVSYRYPLFKLLAATNLEFDFVGSVTDPNSYQPVNGKVFPSHYEGHWGYKIEDINAGLPGWMGSYTPDWSLILLGTNRIVGESAASIKTKMSLTIDLLRAKNPKIVIFLGRPYQVDLATVAAAFALLAQEKTTANSPVIAVGPPTGWNSSTHTYDGAHPNQAGADLLAQTWFQAIQTYLSSTNTEKYRDIHDVKKPEVIINRAGNSLHIKLSEQQARLEISDISGRIISTREAINGNASISMKQHHGQLLFLRVIASGNNQVMPLK